MMKYNDLDQLVEQLINKILAEEIGLTKSFDKLATAYRDLEEKKQKLLKLFLTNLKAEQDPKKKDTMKLQHIAAMKKLDNEIEIAYDKMNNALNNISADDEDDSEHDYMKD